MAVGGWAGGRGVGSVLGACVERVCWLVARRARMGVVVCAYVRAQVCVQAVCVHACGVASCLSTQRFLHVGADASVKGAALCSGMLVVVCCRKATVELHGQPSLFCGWYQCIPNLFCLPSHFCPVLQGVPREVHGKVQVGTSHHTAAAYLTRVTHLGSEHQALYSGSLECSTERASLLMPTVHALRSCV